MATSVPASPGSCALCGVARVGPWCHACGQASRDAPRGLREVLVGQTGKLLYTLRLLLLQPGELAREIDEGRDRHAMRPLTLLLNLVAVFFLVGGGANGFSARLLAQGDIATIVPRLQVLVKAPDTPQKAVAQERIEERFRSVYSLLVIVQTAAYALAFRLLERRKRKPWLVHFAAAIHYMCASFLASMVVFGAGRVLGIAVGTHPLPGAVLYLVVLAYMALALRRVYGDRTTLAVGKAVVALLFGLVVSTVLSYAALAAAVVAA